MISKKIMGYKTRLILSSNWFIYGTVFLICIFNFSALFNSGVLLSGGANINKFEKFELVMNNYNMVSSLYGLIFSICLGAAMIGPDVKSGNIYVVLSIVNSRKKYYTNCVLVGLIQYFVIHSVITINCIIIMLSLSVNIIWSDIIYVCLGLYLNAIVYFMFTSVFSVVMKGYSSIIAGIIMYAYFSVYTYNKIPFVEGYIGFDISSHKNLLSIFFPARNLFLKSFSDISVIEQYTLNPLGINAPYYQIIYCIIMFILGMYIFEKKNL